MKRYIDIVREKEFLAGCVLCAASFLIGVFMAYGVPTFFPISSGVNPLSLDTIQVVIGAGKMVGIAIMFISFNAPLFFLFKIKKEKNESE